MATGDNGLTAISVAKQCGIIRDDIPVFLGEFEHGEVKWKNLDEIRE